MKLFFSDSAINPKLLGENSPVDPNSVLQKYRSKPDCICFIFSTKEDYASSDTNVFSTVADLQNAIGKAVCNNPTGGKNNYTI